MLRCGKPLIDWEWRFMLRRTIRFRLAGPGRIGYLWTPAVRPVKFQRQVRFPMGKGQAPGTATGLGVAGAGGFAAGWAEEAAGAGRRRGTAGFFLAAFFLADFLVGFFLPVLFAAARRLAGARFFFAALPADLRAAFLAGLRALFFPGLAID
jgi:hypothetical protein